jgi:hypothetical protein
VLGFSPAEIGALAWKWLLHVAKLVHVSYIVSIFQKSHQMNGLQAEIMSQS